MTFVFFLTNLDQSILNALGGWVSIGATSKTMIQNMILPKIGLPHGQYFKRAIQEPLCLGNAIQGDHCVPIP